MNTHSIMIINYGHVFLGVILFILFYKTFNKLKIKENFILKFSDKYSYYIYLTHQIFILNRFSVLSLTKNTGLNILFIFLLSFISGVLLKFIYNCV